MKTKNKYILFTGLLVVLIVTGAYSQVPAIEWENSFGGSAFDYAMDIDLTSDGGYVVVGFTNSDDGDVTVNHGINDIWVVKMNSIGNMEWQKSLGGTSNDKGHSIQQTTDGGYIIGGDTRSTNADVSGGNGESDFWAVKLDGSGNIEWQNSMGGFRDDFGREIIQTSDGGYIMTGFVYSIDGDVTGNHGDFDYWVVKLNSLGIIQWQKALGGTFGDEGDSIQQTSDGGYIVAGHSFSSDGDVTTGNQGLRDFWIVKLDSSGNIQWDKSMGGSATEYAQSIIQTLDGGYIVCGDTYSNDGDVSGNHGYADFWVVKLNAAGAIEWKKTLGGSQADNANKIIQTADGGYVVAGYTESNDEDVTGFQGARDYWLVKLDNSGNLLWQKTFGTTAIEEAESIALTVDGGYIVAGFNSDYWVVKLEPDVLSISDIDKSELVIYPTIATEHITIFGKANHELESIGIYDLNGRFVLNKKFENSLNIETINVSSFVSGNYFAKINWKNGVSVKRFVKK